MTKQNIEKKIFDLILKTASELPKDVLSALNKALKKEPANSIASQQLKLMLENAKIAKEKKLPLCQDTGLLLFSIETANFANAQEMIIPAIKTAVEKATKESILRVNTVNSLDGQACVNNLAAGFPQIEIIFTPSTKRTKISLLMKGGGSENIGAQYSLPDETLGAERDLDGIQKAVIDSVVKAQGKGCPPGAIAVCVGGDRGLGFNMAKKLFFREIGTRNKNPIIAKFEISLLKKINSLGIGAQGLGGKTFALELFAELLPRHPASFFVSISYMCWAWRRGKIFLP